MPSELVSYKNGLTKPMVTGQFMDVNSDGLPDWVVAYRHNINSTGTYSLSKFQNKLKSIQNNYKSVRATYINTGTGWRLDNSFPPRRDFSKHTFTPVTVSNYNTSGREPMLVSIEITGYTLAYTTTFGQLADMNADGVADWVQSYDSTANNSTWITKNINSTLLPDKLVEIQNGIGGTSSVEYESATNVQGAIRAQPAGTQHITPQNLALVANPSPRKLVVRTTQSDAISGAFGA